MFPTSVVPGACNDNDGLGADAVTERKFSGVDRFAHGSFSHMLPHSPPVSVYACWMDLSAVFNYILGLEIESSISPVSFPRSFFCLLFFVQPPVDTRHENFVV